MSGAAGEARVVIDVQALQNPMHCDRGIGRYLRAHVDALLDAGAPVAAVVLNPDQPGPTSLPDRWVDAGLVRWNAPALAREMSAGADPFVYHITSPFEPAVPEDGVVVRHMLQAATAVVVTLYDVIPYVLPELYQRDDATRSFFRRRAGLVHVADAVLAISQHTRRDAIEHLGLAPARVHYIGSGPSAGVTGVTGATELAGAHLPSAVTRPFVLTVSGWGEPRKNPHATFAAYAALAPSVRADHQLVVVCAVPDEGRRAWRNELRDLGLDDDEVVIAGHVDDATLAALYAHTSLFVFTSRYEGFGLPALEAACAGAPVVTSDVSSLPEVIEHPLAHVPLDDAEALARRMAEVLTDRSTSETLRGASARAAQTHTWSAVANRTRVAYDAVTASTLRRASATAGSAGPNRIRAAIVGPFPPSKSGIATFNARLVAALETTADIDVFSEGGECRPSTRSSPAPRHRHFPVDAFGRVFGSCGYDATIYTIGNGYYHRRTLAAALRTPGIVWLHEVHLAGLYQSSAGLFLPGVEPGPVDIERARRVMADAVVRLHGPGARPLGDDDWWRTEAYDEHGYSFLSEVVASARGVIVSTAVAAEAVRALATSDVDVHIVPLPFPKLAPLPALAALAPPGAMWVVSLGWVDQIKQPEVLLRAIAAVRADGTDVRLAFVGELAPRTRTELDVVAAELGVTDVLIYTGFVTTDQYAEWLGRADVAVQLRATSRGEASAALNDAIAAGVPTVTNMANALELPPNVVEHIDATNGTALITELTTTLVRLLNDAPRREALSRAAVEHAASWRFDDLAARVLDIVAATSRQTPTAACRG